MNYNLLILLCFNIFFSKVEAASFNAKVIAVMDGDTVLVVRLGHKPEKVRLLHIDAPEKAQPYGPQSQQSLADMVQDRQVKIVTTAHDQYGRLLGEIFLQGHNVNQVQVRRGMAWEYSGYRNNPTYLSLQRAAQRERRGLWHQARPTPPWIWRKRHRAQAGE